MENEMESKRTAAPHAMKSPASGKRILMVVAEMGHPARCRIRGVSRYAKRAGWTVDVLEARHSGGTSDFSKWIAFWRPDGLIADGEYFADVRAIAPSARPPVIFGDTVPAEELPPNCGKVSSNAGAIAEAALRELLHAGHPNLAFVPAPDDPEWSRARARHFAAAARACGRSLTSFKPESGHADGTVRFHVALARFLRSLPKPCGVFAANDLTASVVVSACETCGFSVPDDIAVVGVDDHEEYCERGAVTISSIRLDFERCGEVAAQLLAEMMGAKPGAKPRFAVYGEERVVRRASTSVLRVHDGRVARALEWIRLNAASGIGANDVISNMGCSRSLANLRFRQAVGHSILDEIHARRIGLAKELLERDDIPIDDIPERIGYVPGPFLGMLFKRSTGMTMRQWRRNFLRKAGIVVD